jgi:hypothetical protein
VLERFDLFEALVMEVQLLIELWGVEEGLLVAEVLYCSEAHDGVAPLVNVDAFALLFVYLHWIIILYFAIRWQKIDFLGRERNRILGSTSVKLCRWSVS